MLSISALQYYILLGGSAIFMLLTIMMMLTALRRRQQDKLNLTRFVKLMEKKKSARQQAVQSLVGELYAGDDESIKSKSDGLIKKEQEVLRLLIDACALRRKDYFTRLANEFNTLVNNYCGLKSGQNSSGVDADMLETVKNRLIELCKNEFSHQEDLKEADLDNIVGTLAKLIGDYQALQKNNLDTKEKAIAELNKDLAKAKEELNEAKSAAPEAPQAAAPVDDGAKAELEKQVADVTAEKDAVSYKLARAHGMLGIVFKEYTAMFGIDTGGKTDLSLDEIAEHLGYEHKED